MDTEEAVIDVRSAPTSQPHPSLALSVMERIARIRTELWVSYPEANEALDIMKRLLRAPNEQRPECFAIIGDPSYGKSYLLEQFITRALASDDLAAHEYSVPVLHIEMPESPEPSAMLRELLAGLGAVFSLREPFDELMRKLEVLTKSLDILVFVIDEFHKGFQGTIRQQMILLNGVRGLSNRTKRPLILAGTEKVDSFLRNDEQLDERFIKRRLQRWKDDDKTRMLLKGFEQQIALREPSRLGSRAMTEHIIQLTRGRLGRIARLLALSAEAVILDGSEVIDKAVLSRMARNLPGDTTPGLD